MSVGLQVESNFEDFIFTCNVFFLLLGLSGIVRLFVFLKFGFRHVLWIPAVGKGGKAASRRR